MLFHYVADVDEVVGDHTEPDPTLHSGIAFVPATVEPVPPLDHADAALAPGPPQRQAPETTSNPFDLTVFHPQRDS